VRCKSGQGVSTPGSSKKFEISKGTSHLLWLEPIATHAAVYSLRTRFAGGNNSIIVRTARSLACLSHAERGGNAASVVLLRLLNAGGFDLSSGIQANEILKRGLRYLID